MATGMIPRGSIDVLRSYVDVIMKAVGIDCTLYIPTTTTLNTAEKLDVFATPADYSYDSYTTKTFINWSPNTRLLKKLGLFVEDQLPILARFGNKAMAISVPGVTPGTVVAMHTVLHGYIRIAPEFIPENFEDVEEFEVVDVSSQGFQDAVIRKVYSLVPRRVQI